jgi:hypothetical protein
MALTQQQFEGKGTAKAVPVNTMKITLLRATRVDGKVVNSGDTIEISEKDGNFLVNTGVATLSSAKKEKKTDRSDGLKSSTTKEVKNRG